MQVQLEIQLSSGLVGHLVLQVFLRMAAVMCQEEELERQGHLVLRQERDMGVGRQGLVGTVLLVRGVGCRLRAVVQGEELLLLCPKLQQLEARKRQSEPVKKRKSMKQGDDALQKKKNCAEAAKRRAAMVKMSL
jgi:hypothetical protein